MKLYQKILASGAMIAALSGCTADSLEGTVKEEFGNVTKVVDSSGALFGNDSVKIGNPEYGLVLESQGKIYHIKIENDRHKPIFALAKAIEPGDRVRISNTWAAKNLLVDEDGIGTVRSNWVSIIEKAKK